MSNLISNQRILALDLGEKHIGAAMFTPQAKTSLLDDYEYQSLFQLRDLIIELIREYRAELVVVGDMGLSELPKNIRSELNKVAHTTGVKVEVVSEFLSSFQGEQERVQSGGVKKRDHSSAALQILRDFLERVD